MAPFGGVVCHRKEEQPHTADSNPGRGATAAQCGDIAEHSGVDRGIRLLNRGRSSERLIAEGETDEGASSRSCGFAAFRRDRIGQQPIQLTNKQMDTVTAGTLIIETSNTSATAVSLFQTAYLLDSTPNKITCPSCYLLINSSKFSLAAQFGSVFGPGTSFPRIIGGNHVSAWVDIGSSLAYPVPQSQNRA